MDIHNSMKRHHCWSIMFSLVQNSPWSNVYIPVSRQIPQRLQRCQSSIHGSRSSRFSRRWILAAIAVSFRSWRSHDEGFAVSKVVIVFSFVLLSLTRSSIVVAPSMDWLVAFKGCLRIDSVTQSNQPDRSKGIQTTKRKNLNRLFLLPGADINVIWVRGVISWCQSN